MYAAFIAVTGPTFVEATPVDGGFSVDIPKGFAGQTYVVLTSCDESVTDDTVAAGPAVIEVRCSYPTAITKTNGRIDLILRAEWRLVLVYACCDSWH